MEEGEQIAAGLQEIIEVFDERFDERIGEEIEEVPAKNPGELPFRIVQVLAEESFLLEKRRLAVLRSAPRNAKQVLGVEFVTPAGDEAEIGLGGGTEIENASPRDRLDAGPEFADTVAAAQERSRGTRGARGRA